MPNILNKITLRLAELNVYADLLEIKDPASAQAYFVDIKNILGSSTGQTYKAYNLDDQDNLNVFTVKFYALSDEGNSEAELLNKITNETTIESQYHPISYVGKIKNFKGNDGFIIIRKYISGIDMTQAIEQNLLQQLTFLERCDLALNLVNQIMVFHHRGPDRSPIAHYDVHTSNVIYTPASEEKASCSRRHSFPNLTLFDFDKSTKKDLENYKRNDMFFLGWLITSELFHVNKNWVEFPVVSSTVSLKQLVSDFYRNRLTSQSNIADIIEALHFFNTLKLIAIHAHLKESIPDELVSKLQMLSSGNYVGWLERSESQQNQIRLK